MTLRKFGIASRYLVHRSRVLQILLLVGFWFAGQELVHWTGLPISGGIAGMLIVFALLASGKVSLSSLQRGANWFLAEMLLFFIPAVPVVLDHHEFMGWLGLKILAVILVGTIAVMAVTALAVDLFCLWSSNRGTAKS